MSTIIFLASRYLPFVDSGFLLFSLFASDPSNSSCKIAFEVRSSLYFFGIWISEWILVLRTYAIWNRNKIIGTSMFSLLLAVGAVCSFYMSKTLKNTEFGRSPSSSALPGCFAVAGSSDVSKLFIFAFAFETVILFLTLYKLAQQRKYGNSRLLQSTTNNGIVVYLCLLASTTINLTLLYTFPPELEGGLVTLHRILHAVLTERLILHIRKAAAYTRYGTNADTGLGEIAFAAPPIQATPNQTIESKDSTV